MKKHASLLFTSYQARKTKDQKTAFIQYALSSAGELGYTSTMENTKSGARNVVIGDLNSASVVFTAHYDTPSRSVIPDIIIPKIPFATTLYQIAVALLMLLPSALLFLIGASVLPMIGIPASISVLVSLVLAAAAFVGALYLVICGPACSNNANANTSGVATVFEIMTALPAELRSMVAFVFFDAQQDGCIGSAEFVKNHKRAGIGKKLFVNFDCVGVGDNFVVAYKRGADKFVTALERAFDSDGKISAEVLSGGKKIPSDHNSFKCGVGVTAFKKHSSGILYISGMNSDGDTTCQEENIAYLTSRALKLLNYIKNPSAMAEAPTLDTVKQEAIPEPKPTEAAETAEARETAEVADTEEASV